MKKYNIIILITITLAFLSCKDEVKKNLLKNIESVESSFVDTRDGESYKCVQIGDQTWLAENLRFRLPLGGYEGCVTYNEESIDTTKIKVDKVAFKDSILNAVNSGEIDFQYGAFFMQLFLEERNEEYYNLSLTKFLERDFPDQDPPMTYYDAFEEILPVLYRINSFLQDKAIVEYSKEYTDYDYVKEYGYLYSYEAALKAVPNGWRLPTDDDWKKLEKNLGITEDSELDKIERWRGTTQGEALRKSDKLKFYAKMAGGQAYGITSGYASSNFINKGVKTYYWTATESNLVDSMKTNIIRALQFENPKIYRGTAIQKENPYKKGIYYSVRCVKE